MTPHTRTRACDVLMQWGDQWITVTACVEIPMRKCAVGRRCIYRLVSSSLPSKYMHHSGRRLSCVYSCACVRACMHACIVLQCVALLCAAPHCDALRCGVPLNTALWCAALHLNVWALRCVALRCVCVVSLCITWHECAACELIHARMCVCATKLSIGNLGGVKQLGELGHLRGVFLALDECTDDCAHQVVVQLITVWKLGVKHGTQRDNYLVAYAYTRVYAKGALRDD